MSQLRKHVRQKLRETVRWYAEVRATGKGDGTAVNADVSESKVLPSQAERKMKTITPKHRLRGRCRDMFEQLRKRQPPSRIF
jgi:hypothetical protein